MESIDGELAKPCYYYLVGGDVDFLGFTHIIAPTANYPKRYHKMDGIDYISYDQSGYKIGISSPPLPAAQPAVAALDNECTNVIGRWR